MPVELLLRACRDWYTLLRSNGVGPESSSRGLASLLRRWALRSNIPYEELGGRRTLAGTYSASGRRNEFDMVLGRSPETIVAELKNWSKEVPPEEVMFLFQKAMDHWAVRSVRSSPIYPIFVSSSGLTEEARRSCFMWGITPIEPGLIPPPMIVALFGEHEEARALVVEADRLRAAELFAPFVRGLSAQLAWVSEHRGVALRATLVEQMVLHVFLSSRLQDWLDSEEGPLNSWLMEVERLTR